MLMDPLRETFALKTANRSELVHNDFIETYLAGFIKVDLDDLNTIALMKRYDIKFVFHVSRLLSVLDRLYRDYAVLEIDNKRVFQYRNQYFDTEDYFFYHQHHNQKFCRYKIRCRNYVDTGRSYFEVKCKTNRKKTIKSRLLLDDQQFGPELTEEAKAFARQCLRNGNGQKIDRIKPSLVVNYNRMTLASLQNNERITFDVNLTYSDQACSLKLDHLAIAELKSPRLLMKSPFFQSLKELQIFPAQFSKYCMGIVLMEKNVKYNRFKHNMSLLRKIA
jgi:hypothetical protein